MTSSVRNLCLSAAALVLAAATAASAQGVLPSGGLPLKDIGGGADAPPSTDPRAFDGVWTPAKGLFGTYLPTLPQLPLRPETEQKVKRYVALADQNKRVATPHLTCRPAGAGGLMALKFPVAIVQTPDKVMFVTQEDRDVYQVALNRGHRTPLKPSYNGDSVGRWEGNTLVVDTVGYNGLGFIDEAFWHPNSSSLHMIQRFTKSADGRTLKVETTLEDPVYYTAPIRSEDEWTWQPGARQVEYDCAQFPPDDTVPFTYDNPIFRHRCWLDTSSGEGKPRCDAAVRRPEAR